MEATSVQEYVHDKVTSKRLCSSMEASGEWFPFAFLTGDNIVVYIACQKKSKSVDFHVRWSTLEESPATSAAIIWGDSNMIDLQMPIGQSISTRTKQYVTRYGGRVKLDIFQDLLLSKQVSFVSGSVSEKLVLYSEIDSLVYFLAHCIGHNQLPEALRERLTQEYESIKRKEQEKKKKAEQARKKREEQQKKKEEEFQRQLEIRDIELRPDAKVLAKFILEKYSHDLKNYNVKWTTCDAYFLSDLRLHFPQFNDFSYSNEVEKLLINRNILWKFDYSHYEIKTSLLDVVSLNQLYDIIDKKTTAEEVIKSARLAAESTQNNKTGGCYIATCVYGSYDCPEVWTLRRYRDQVLRHSFVGRLFIKVYYALSPILVNIFGETELFQKINRYCLDNWVSKLNKNGFDNKPYQDR